MKSIKYIVLTALFLVSGLRMLVAQETEKSTTTYVPTPWSIRAYGVPMMTKLASNTFGGEESRALGLNGGAEIAYYFLQLPKFKMSIATGLGISSYNSKRLADYENKGWTSEFEEILNAQQTFYLTETAKNWSEKQNAKFMDIPVKLGFDYLLSPKWAVYANAGVAYGVALSSKYTGNTTITRTGFYPDYNVLIFDVDVAGSPYYYPTNKLATGSGSFNLKNNFSSEFALGAKYSINPKLSVYAGAKLMSGYNTIKNNDATMTIATSPVSLNSMMSRVDKVTTSALGLEIGVQFDLFRSEKVKPEAPVVKPVELKSEPVVVKEPEVKSIDTVVIKPVITPVETVAPVVSDKKILLKLENINFETASYTLTPAYASLLSGIAKSLADSNETKIIISGHADSVGSSESNILLSKRRANAVREFLLKNGVNAENLTTNWFGEDKPISTNSTPAGRAQNRRVELKVAE